MSRPIRTESGAVFGRFMSHTEPFADEEHSHFWEVAAFRPCYISPPPDGRLWRDDLAAILTSMWRDMNAVLGDQATNEGLARHVMKEMGDDCCRVIVRRPNEGLMAEVSR